MGIFRAFAWVVLLILAIGLGGAIFQSGYLAGLAAEGGGAVVNPGFGYGWGWGWGFGGGLFGILALLFFLFLFIAILRAAFGGHRGWGPGPKGWGGYGDHHGRDGRWEERAREVHEEWHRREGQGGGSGSSVTGPSAGPSGGGPTA